MSRVVWPLTISLLVYIVAEKLHQTFLREQRYKLIYTVPLSHLAATKKAVFAAGAGVYDGGKYRYVDISQLW